MHALLVTTHGDAVGPTALSDVPAAPDENQVNAAAGRPSERTGASLTRPENHGNGTEQAEVPPAMGRLATALSRLRAALGAVSYPLVLPSAEEAQRVGSALLAQLDDYLLPRLARLDAPLLVVVGGCTGAGK